MSDSTDSSWFRLLRTLLKSHGLEVVGPSVVPPAGWISGEHVEAAGKMLTAFRGMVALQWACEVGATVEEMKAWDRAEHGEDLTNAD